MGVVALMLAQGAPSGSPMQTLLSTTNKAPDITLSNGDRDADSNMTQGGIALSASGKTTGKFYVECLLSQRGPADGFAFGLHRETASLTTYLGGNANGWGSWVSSANRRTFTNATMSNDASVGAPSVNIRARMAVDIGAGQLWLSHFGNTSWLGGGDPVAGTSPTYTFTPGGDMFYIALCPYHGVVTPTTSRNRLRLVLPADWASAAPSGFGVWTA